MCNYISNYLKQVKLIAATWCMWIDECNARKCAQNCWYVFRRNIALAKNVVRVYVRWGECVSGRHLCVCVCDAVESANLKNM